MSEAGAGSGRAPSGTTATPGGTLAHRVPDLGALELLLAVARLGSLGRAARELGITQPAASSRVRTMERMLGVALVERSPRGSRLTDAGVLVTDWARRIVEAAEAFDAGAQALRGRRDSRLRVAASMTIAEYLLPGWLIALRTRRPGTAVSLFAGNSSAVAERLLAAEADLGFVEGLAVPPGLDGAVIGHDRLVVVTAPGHPWARRRTPLDAAELAATPLILRERGSGTRQVLDAALASQGGVAEPLLELASTTAAKAAVVSGAGPSVLSELAVGEELAARRLVEIPVPGVGLRRDLRAVWPTGHRPTGPARDLLGLTR
ncbi:CysJI operon transcriptional activator [Streptomyces netropsis]|uniref:Molybdate transport repressor ModE-like protein n=1 Tax=Streptomyces syringium TaxID=76729 RepID=A0ABS4XZS0_9ACTN|nr:LysR family transcriptional regulator [Streptomyces syringium]MBP2402014.1 molybdate transport repressor ModE-like protein [Streptomyces syringium]SPE48503.1 CysJI operon transcriptional activator [Streptomyces netropsis]